ncbi:MAG: TonB family protein [Bacteroidales bacterium]
MNQNKKNKMFSHSGHPEESTLWLYTRGDLNREDAHKVEAHLIDCEMCSDVAEGFAGFESERSLTASRNRVSELFEAGIRKKRRQGLTRMLLAASFVILALSSVVMIRNMNTTEVQKEVAVADQMPEKGEKPTKETGIAKDDSLDNVALNESGKGESMTSWEPEKKLPAPTETEEEIIQDEEMQTQDNEIATIVIEDLHVVENEEVANVELNAYEMPEEMEDADTDDNAQEQVNEHLSGGTSGEATSSADRRQKAISDHVISEKSAMPDSEPVRQGETDSGADLEISAEAGKTAEIAMDAFEEESDEEAEPISFAVVEEKPEFPGGDTALMNFISTNAEYPDDVRENAIEGRVFVHFVIDTNGRVSNVSVARGVDPALDKEAMRVVRMMPDWKPGKQGGKAVAVTYILPISFDL